MKIKAKEVDCVFFWKAKFPHNGKRDNRDWEPGCILKDYYCSRGFGETDPCSSQVPCTNRNKIANICRACIENLSHTPSELKEESLPQEDNQ